MMTRCTSTPLVSLQLTLPRKLLLFTAVLLLSSSDATFILNVPYYDEVCFIVRTPPGPEVSLVTGSFDLLDDKLRPDPISIVVLNDKLEHLFQSTKSVHSGTFAVATTGRVSVCARNAMDDDRHTNKDRNLRVVGLDVQVMTLDKTSAIMEAVQRLHSKVFVFKSLYDYVREREAQHREVAEETFTKLLFWSLLEAACVLVVSAAQIFYMRRFVENKRAF